MKKLLSGAAAAALLSSTATAQNIDNRFDDFFVIGDSLSDTGSLSGITFGLLPGGNYYNGRFSNGPVWAERLGFNIGRDPGLLFLDPLFPFFVDGYSFAHGGAASGPVGPLAFGPLDAQNQASRFDSLSGYLGVGGDDLGALWVGNNDYLLNGLTDPSVAVANIEDILGVMSGAGLETIILFGVPRLGLTPSALDDPQRSAQLNALSFEHNALLRGRVSGLEGELGTDLIFIETGIAFDIITALPQLFGLSNVTDACLDNGLVLNACPDDWLFYDGVHPTDRGHEIISRIVEASVIREAAPAVSGRALRASGASASLSTAAPLRARLDAASRGVTGVSFMAPGAFGPGRTVTSSGVALVSAPAPRRAATTLYAFSNSPDGAFLDAASTRLTGLSGGVETTAFGMDVWANDRLLLGGLAAFSAETNAFDVAPVGAAVEESAAANLYALYQDGDFTASAWLGVAQDRREARRATGLAELPLAYGEAETATATLAMRATRSFALAGIALSPSLEAGFAAVTREAYRENGTLGLLDADIPAESAASAHVSLGLVASRDWSASDWSGRFDLTAAVIAASDARVGLAPAVNAAVLRGDDAALAESGVHLGLGVSLFEAHGFALRADAETLASGAGVEEGYRLRGVFRF